MRQSQIQIPIGGLPVNLVLLSNGCVVFVKVAEFDLLIDQPRDGELGAEFRADSFSINDVEYSYRVIYEYKHIPDMLQWLQQQNLMEPAVMFA